MSEKRKAKAKPETFVRVTTRTEEDGITVFTDPNGFDVAWKLPRGGVVDLRTEPPYLSMSPCPYCGAVNDVGHFPAGHVHPYLGEKV
jgi:hypothetical protein